MKKIVDMEEWSGYYKEVMRFYDEQHPYDRGYINATDNIDDWLESQPDAEEKHGKWEDDVKVTEYGEWKGIKCSQCGFGIYDVVLFNDFKNFCGHCGTKMYLGEEE